MKDTFVMGSFVLVLIVLVPIPICSKVKCYKIKIKPGINRAKSGFIPLGELSTIILLAPSSLAK